MTTINQYKMIAKYLVTALFVTSVANAAEPMAELEPLVGIWQSQGQGLVLKINSDHVTAYDHTTISCIETNQASGDEFFRVVPLVSLSGDQQLLQLRDSGAVVNLRFQRLARLPETCMNGGTQASADPELNFEVFWNTFAENYRWFAKRGVDWQQIYQQYRPQVNAQTSDAELFALFAQMIDPLNDGHSSISDGDDNTFESFQAETESSVFRQLTHEFHQQHLIDNPQHYFAQAFGSVGTVVKQNYLQGAIKTGALDNMFWGKTADGFGYLYLGSMEISADEENGVNPAQTLAKVRASMIEMIADLIDVKGLIIDLRLNPGGTDAIAFEAASFFNNHRLPVFGVQYALANGQLSQTESAYLPVAQTARYNQPIAILISEFTHSAAETLALAMRELPNVSLIGSKTAGNLSNKLEKQLPNGWAFSLASDVYRSQDGREFEAEGIPPQVHVDFLQRSDRVLARDTAIDTAKQVLEQDQAILSQMQAADIPALSTSLVVNGKTIISKVYGYADISQQRRATADTPFQLASVSKTFIAVALMQLVEQGLLSLDTPINDVLPFPVDNPKLDNEIITIRHLATHTSGLIDNADVYDNSLVLETESVPTLAAVLQDYYSPDGKLYDAQLNFAATPPGTHYEYSNIAATLAAYIVEVRSGLSFDDYVEQHIFQPLQMQNSHYHLAQFPENTAAIPYGLDNEGQFYHYPTYPDGMLRSSANDLAAYLTDLTTGEALLERASIERMWTPLLAETPAVPDIGVIWDLGSFNTEYTNTYFVEHGGADPGVASELQILPDLAVGAAVVMNTDRIDADGQFNAANDVLFNTAIQLLLTGSKLAINQQIAINASGSWYDPSRDGQGVHIEVLADNQAEVIWFGYDAQGQQLWAIGTGQIAGNRIDIPTAYQTSGGVFGANLDPAAVQRITWGEMVFAFEESNGNTTATWVYNSRQAAQHGEQSLSRLTQTYLPQSPNMIRNTTGTWFDPDHNGEGFILQQLDETEAILYWLTYTPDGHQAWLIGNGRLDGDTFTFPEMQTTSATPLGNASSVRSITRKTWGSITLTINNCQQIEAQYQGLFGAGEWLLQRLTKPVAVECK